MFFFFLLGWTTDLLGKKIILIIEAKKHANFSFFFFFFLFLNVAILVCSFCCYCFVKLSKFYFTFFLFHKRFGPIVLYLFYFTPCNCKNT